MNSKYYQVAGITIAVSADLPITENTFHPKFKLFEVDGLGADNVSIRHHFNKKASYVVNAEDRVYLRPPWAIYRKGDQWFYEWIETEPPYRNYYRKVIANNNHTEIDIYNDKRIRKKFSDGGLTSLAMFPTDQIILGRLLAYKRGCIMHSLGIILNDHGYLFVGHSSAGKSTMARMMSNAAVILCDDRNIIRKKNDHCVVSGTWSHGDVTDISPLSAPLKGIFFLEQADTNGLVRIENSLKSFKILLACLIRPITTIDWWDISIDFIAYISKSVPCWYLKFDKSGDVLDVIRDA